MKHKTTTISLIIAFIAAFITLAISAAESIPDPCSLVTLEEIKTILGIPVQPGKSRVNENPAAGSECTYTVGDYGSLVMLVKALYPGEIPEKIKARLAKRNKNPVDVKNLGDSSFFTSPGHDMVQLHTFCKQRYILFTIMVPGMKEAALQPLTEKLMRLLLPRIK